MKRFTITLLLSLAAQALWAQTPVTCSSQDSLLIADKLKTVSVIKPAKGKSTGPLVSEIGKTMLGTPYVAHTLEVNAPEERLVLNLQGLDCTTFMENSFALAQLRKQDALNMASYQDMLRRLRYHGGKIDGYASRLHYFVEWMRNAQAQGLLQDVTQQVGGERLDVPVNFMSQHPQAYAQLKADEGLVAAVSQSEQAINAQPMYYIPKEKLRALEGNIQEGDLIGITTSVPGLDTSHVGIATFKNGRLHLLHASQTLKKVVVSSEPMVDYLMGNKKQTGIMVARPK